MNATETTAVLERLERIEKALGQLVRAEQTKDWYSTAELAEILGKAEFTVRQWCRFRRLEARKRACGRGRSKEWVVSHAELERYRNEGLRPLPPMQ
jgi:hypothetical protein